MCQFIQILPRENITFSSSKYSNVRPCNITTTDKNWSKEITWVFLGGGGGVQAKAGDLTQALIPSINGN